MSDVINAAVILMRKTLAEPQIEVFSTTQKNPIRFGSEKFIGIIHRYVQL